MFRPVVSSGAVCPVNRSRPVARRQQSEPQCRPNFRSGITVSPGGGILYDLKGERIVVAVGDVDTVENSSFATPARKNAIRKSVEELSTYPHRQWITGECAEIVGKERGALRRSSTATRIVPISPTRRTRIIHNVGDLSTKNGRLSPGSVESRVLPGSRTLVKWRRTYYAFAGTAMRRTGRPSYPHRQLSPNARCRCG